MKRGRVKEVRGRKEEEREEGEGEGGGIETIKGKVNKKLEGEKRLNLVVFNTLKLISKIEWYYHRS